MKYQDPTWSNTKGQWSVNTGTACNILVACTRPPTKQEAKPMDEKETEIMAEIALPQSGRLWSSGV